MVWRCCPGAKWSHAGGRGTHGSHLQQQLHHIHVHQAQDRLPVDVRDEVTSAQPSLLRRAALLHTLPTQNKGSDTPSCTRRPLET